MTVNELADKTAAGFEIIADMLENPELNDPRLAVLRAIFPGPPPPLVQCPQCLMPRADMFWHPNDNLNHCPRCSAPLR